LKPLLQQLAAQSPLAVDIPKLSYSAHGNGLLPPQTDTLLSLLKKIAHRAAFTCIVLDALDECLERDDLLDFLKTISDWRLGNLSVLVTSRPEKLLQDVLAPIAKFSVDISGAAVDEDIALFVRERFRNVASIKRWPQSLKDRAESVLIQGAGGMLVPF
jgi:hypothetical protein